MRTLAQRLKALRKEHDPELSQLDLAKLSGVSQTTISNIEKGRNQGSKFIVDLASALEVRPQWLADESGPKTDLEGSAARLNVEAGAPAELPAELKKVLAAYKTAGPVKKEAFSLLSGLPEHEMATLVLVMQSIGAKYKK